MSRIIKYSILYYYKRLNYKILGILSLIVILFSIKTLKEFIELNAENFMKKNAWDFYSFSYIDSSIIVNVVIFLSLYVIFSCFQSNEKEAFLKIRCDNSFIWFTSKIISIFIFNFIIIILATMVVFTVGMFAFGMDLGWSELAHDLRPYAKAFSPIEFALLNILTYTFYVTFLSQIIGILLVKTNSKKIVGILVMIYLILDRYIFSLNEKIVDILKYFSLNSYIAFGNRPYYQSSINYITVKEGLMIPFILAVGTCILIKCISKTRKVIS